MLMMLCSYVFMFCAAATFARAMPIGDEIGCTQGLVYLVLSVQCRTFYLVRKGR